MEPEVRGAGGVIWRRLDPNRVEVVLVHHHLHGDWSLPKGKQDPGEDLTTCALREVEEETGMTCSADDPIGVAHYVDRLGRTKAVHYWSMHAGSDESLHTLSPTLEIDDARWVSLPDALTEADLSRDRFVLWAFAGRMGLTSSDLTGQNPDAAKLSRKAPILVIRHASAGDRYAWGDDDTARPLDAKGASQSSLLAGRIAGYPIARIVSSPAARCIETVEPLAALTGLPIDIEPRLGEGQGAHAGDLLAEYRNQGVVVCTHGDVVDEALRFIASTCELPLPGDGGSKKASVWVFNGNGSSNGDGPSFRIAGYLAPPAS